MQILDDQKREKILDSASELFAARPFHKVLLSDVAAAACVGKGTLYLYFKDKEDLFLSVLYRSFSRVVDSIRERIETEASDESSDQALEAIIRELVQFASGNPHIFELMRSMPGLMGGNSKWSEKRKELSGLIESIIRQGISRGEFEDPHPELTAIFIPGLVRSAILHGFAVVDHEALVEHMLRFVRSSLGRCASR